MAEEQKCSKCNALPVMVFEDEDGTKRYLCAVHTLLDEGQTVYGETVRPTRDIFKRVPKRFRDTTEKD